MCAAHPGGFSKIARCVSSVRQHHENVAEAIAKKQKPPYCPQGGEPEPADPADEEDAGDIGGGGSVKPQLEKPVTEIK